MRYETRRKERAFWKDMDNTVIKAYTQMDMPVSRYVLLYLVPSIISFLAVNWILTAYFPRLIGMPVIGLIIEAFPFLIPSFSILYPIIARENRKMEIESYMNLFITRMGALSTSNLPRKEIMRMLSEVDEYGALRDEIKKIYVLMDMWNYSLPEAARYVAKRTPSLMLSDFLERMAHAIDSGEDFGNFLKKEQDVVMTEYSIMYSAAMKNLDLFKEIYISMITTAMFMFMFVSLLPMFAGVKNPLSTMIGTYIIFVIIELSLFLYIRFKMPQDDVWHSMKIRPQAEERIKIYILFSALTAVLFLYLSLLFSLSFQLMLSISAAPFIVPGILISMEEKDTKRCDENYEAFMRSVGSVVETSGGSVRDALKKLRIHDFGPLTEHINVLYNRITMRIDNNKAWMYFAAETGSGLIAKFTEMYVKAIWAGGKPTEIGRIISKNFMKMVSLRKERYQQAGNLTGVIYGLSVVIVATLFLALNIMRLMNSAIESVAIPTNTKIPIFVTTYNTDILNIFIFLIIVTNAIFSSVILRYISGSHKYVSFLHFTIMIWIGAIGSVLSDFLSSSIFGHPF